MQDKSFDELFKNEFDGAEMQPTANLWNNIAKELTPKPKRKLPVYWMAAALALVVIGIGLMMPETEKIRLQAKVETVSNGDIKAGTDRIQHNKPESELKEIYKSTPLIIAPRLKDEAFVKENLAALQPEPVIIRHEDKEPEIIKEKPVVASRSIPAEERMIASVSPVENIETAVQTENKGIRNLGDLVNFVVNKVDKREKKILQFDTDDDNSALVSINIGFIKFNKKSDK